MSKMIVCGMLVALSGCVGHDGTGTRTHITSNEYGNRIHVWEIADDGSARVTIYHAGSKSFRDAESGSAVFEIPAPAGR